MKIYKTVYNLYSGQEYMVEMTMFNVQRAVTPKVGKSVTVYWFCTSSHGALYLCEVL